MALRWYILRDREPVPVSGMREAVEWQMRNWDKRHVAYWEYGDITVSTIFLGLDHRMIFQQDMGEPLIFETMILGGEHSGWARRCGTWAQAERFHDQAMRLVRDSSVSVQRTNINHDGDM